MLHPRLPCIVCPAPPLPRHVVLHQVDVGKAAAAQMAHLHVVISLSSYLVTSCCRFLMIKCLVGHVTLKLCLVEAHHVNLLAQVGGPLSGI